MDQIEFLSVGQVSLDSIRDSTGSYGPFAGGGALYPAVVASQLGMRVAVYGTVGSDFPIETLNELRDLGLNTDGIKLIHGETARLLLNYADTGNETVSISPGVGYLLSPRDVSEKYTGSRVIHVATVQPPFVPGFLEWAASTGDVLISFAPKSDLSGQDPDLIRACFANTDALFFNEAELSLYSHAETVEDKAFQLLNDGPDLVVVTLGARGSMIFTSKEVIEVEPHPVTEIRNLCGAGDAYLAGFWFAHLRGCALSKCGAFASIIATCVMRNYGLPLEQEPFDLLLSEPFCAEIVDRGSDVLTRAHLPAKDRFGPR